MAQLVLLIFATLGLASASPSVLRGEKAACGCAASAEVLKPLARGWAASSLKDTWQSAREAQPERRPRVLLQELSSCARATA